MQAACVSRSSLSATPDLNRLAAEAHFGTPCNADLPVWQLRVTMSPDETPPDADESLRRFAATGDPGAAAALFDATAPALFRVALSLARDAASAEDALQETYLTALERAGRYDAGRPALRWLMGILERKVWRQRRDARRAPDPQRLVPPRAVADPLDTVASREDRERVRAAIDALPEPYRGVAILRWRYGLEPAEIAHVRDEPPGTVRSLLHRAARKLEAELGALPAVVATGGGGVALAAVRQRVVDGAARLAPVPSAPRIHAAKWTKAAGTLLTGSLTTGGLIVGATQKIVAAAAALVLLLAGGYGVWSVTQTHDEPSRADGAAAEDVSEATRRERHRTPGEEEAETAEPPAELVAELPPPVDLDAADRDRDLHGRVVDPDGAPLAGAVIRTESNPAGRANVLTRPGAFEPVPGPGTRSARDGTFAIRLRRGASVDVIVECAGYGSRMIRRVNAGERLLVELAREGEGAAAGRLGVEVVDEGDVPVEAARVRVLARRLSPVGSVDRRSATDAAGAARFLGLPPRADLYVVVDADGFADPPWATVTLPGEGDASVRVVLPRGRTLTGTVTDAATGRPVAGARIGMNWTQTHAVETGTDGHYELPGWTGRNVLEVGVTAEGYGRAKEFVGDRTVVDVALEPGDSVSGRVVDTAGAPVAGAYVSAMASSRVHTGTQRTSFGTAVTGADGCFCVTSLCHDLVHTLIVTAEGFGRLLLDFDPHRNGPGTVELGDVVVKPGHAIEGVVVDSDGSPVPRVLVVLKGANTDRARLRGQPSPDLSFYGSTEERSTDDLGRFRFPDLAPGEYSVHARPEKAPEGASGFRLGAGDITDARVLIGRGRSVIVRATGPDGGPLEGVVVMAALSSEQVDGRTDAAGEARFTLPAGESAHLIAKAPAGLADDVVMVPQSQTLAADASEASFAFVRGKRVRLRIVDPDKHPISGVGVEIDVGTDRRVYAQTDMDGRISALVTADRADVRVLPYRVVIDGKAVRQERTRFAGTLVGLVPGGGEVTLRCVAVDTDRTLDVRVLDPDGAPVQRAQVGVTMSSSSALTGADGVAHLDNLRAEPLQVWVFVGTRKDGPALLRPLPVDVAEPNGQTIEIRCRRAARVTGVVLDKSGNTVRGASVTARVGDEVLGTCVSEVRGVFDLDVPADTAPFRLTATWAASDGASVTTTLDDVRPDTDVRLQAK